MYFFFKQQTAYDMRISDWSSDVCSSDLASTFQNLLSSSEDIATAATQVLLRLSSILSEENAERVAGALDSINEVAQTLAAERDQIQATLRAARQIGRATCRERVCPDV